jgi:CHAT domain-containing protein/tetratricopeptide (TPR) repeat protein
MCVAAYVVSGAVQGAPSASTPCLGAGGLLLDRHLALRDSPVSVALPRWQGRDLAVLVAEEGIDVEASLTGASGPFATDSPLPRQGIQRLLITRETGDVSALLKSVDQTGHPGAVRLRVFALQDDLSPDCLQWHRDLARADHLFAVAQAASRQSPAGASADPEAASSSAEQAYRQIAGSRIAREDAQARAEAQLNVAAVDYYSLSRWDEAATSAGAAAASAGAAGNSDLHARARALQAAAWLEKPENGRTFERARAVFDELAEFHRTRGEHYDEALQINLAGVSYFNEARFELAIPRYREAQALFARLGETQRAALALQNLALCEWGLGRIRQALPLFVRALRDMDASQRPTHFLLTLNNAALANQAAGHFDESLDLLDRALHLATRIGNKYYRARALFGIGVTYYGIGDRDLARQFLQDALAIWTPQLDERGRLAALRALAVIESESGELDQADRHDREALALARSSIVHDRISLKMARTALARGDLAAAEALVAPLLSEGSRAERLTQAGAWVTRAGIKARTHTPREAEVDLRRAIAVFQDLDALSDEFEARVELARALRSMGRNVEASAEIASALDRSEELGAQTANPEYRASVAGAIRPAMDLRLDLLWDDYERERRAGNPRVANEMALKALTIADAARGKSLDLQRYGVSARDPKLEGLVEERAALMRDLADRRYYLATRDDRAGQQDERARKLREEIRSLRVSLGLLDTKIARRVGSTGAALPASLEGALARLAHAEGVGAIEYWVGVNSAYAWVANRRSLTWVKLQAGEQIDAAARHFQQTLTAFATVPVRDRLLAAEDLYRLVVAPLDADLRGATTWIIVADGPLHFVPFAALRKPGPEPQYVVERAALVMTPALRHLPDTLQPPGRGQGRILLVSDPIYQASDPRLAPGLPLLARRDDESLPRLRAGSGAGTWSRLPATAREADGIRRLFVDAEVDDLRGPDANRASFLARDLSRYRYVHIAAHGVIDAEIPAMSALILGAFDRQGAVADQQIRAGDLMSKTFDADLVVLSACSTSLGRDYPDEGPMGLRYAMLARGARTVIASLWSTADELNAQLMTDMYARLIGKGRRAESALAEAMRAMLGRTPDMDPALWAPYSVYAVDN